MTDPLSEASIRRLIRQEIRAAFEEIRRGIPRLTEREMTQRKEAAKRSAAARTKQRPVEEIQRPVEAPVEIIPEKTKTRKRPVKRSVESGAPTEESSAPSARTWLAYASAYKLRYGTFPVRNAKVNALLTQFIRRIPQEEAPRVAEFYLKHEGKLYVSSAHCVELMLRDSEKLRMEWATGRRTNGVDVAVGRSWWETWSGIQQKGSALHVEPDEQPQIYKAKVLKAAAASGDLPREIAEKLGVS
jgi:hypothetical protein